MSEDARFEDVPGGARPLRLKAETAEDLTVLSSLLQDAVGTAGEIVWARGRQRLVLLLNRFRWEDVPAAERAGRSFERVQAALTIEAVTGVRARGLPPGEPETVYSLLAMAFEAGEDGAGTLVLTLAGDGALAATVECLDVQLADVTRPWQARAKNAPSHDA
ncbi:MAG: DUF2948 family protein [Pseudomonadota bacterium]